MTLCLMAMTAPSEGGRVKRQAFLCKVPKICQMWCRISGHSDGTCDEEEDCNCSTESVDRHFCSEEYDAEEQHTICAGWCQFRGQQTGDCNSSQECECVEKELEGDHLKCVSDAVCKMYCHFDKKAATGKCQGAHGWDCVCYEDPEENQVITDADDE